MEHVGRTARPGLNRAVGAGGRRRTMYDKDASRENGSGAKPATKTLVLIVCGGDFDPDISRYRQNIVVHAVPIA